MRVRETVVDPVLYGPRIETWSTGHPAHIDLGPYYYKATDQYGRIADDPTRRTLQYATGIKRQLMKAVDHERWHATLNHASVVFSTSSTNWQTSAGGQVLAGFKNDPSAAADVASLEVAVLKSKGTHTDVFYQQWEKARPTMATRASLSVFLYELRDLKRMFQILPAKHIRVGIKKRTPGSWYDVLQYVNGQHLNYNFGWKPFVRDIRAVFKGAQSFENRLKRFRDGQNQELRRHVRNPPQDDTGSEDVATPFYPFRIRRQWTLTTVQCSTFEYLYELPEMSDQEMRWRGWLDTLGLNVNPSTIWAVIPWSFVVDWFINVGGALRSSESDWVEPAVTYHQGCHSWKTTGSMITDVYSSLGGVSPGCVNVNYSHYTRTTGSPNFSLVTPPLDADKIRLGSSLFLSRFR